MEEVDDMGEEVDGAVATTEEEAVDGTIAAVDNLACPATVTIATPTLSLKSLGRLLINQYALRSKDAAMANLIASTIV